MSSERRRAIVVTGATGFVGARFLELAGERHDVFALARRPPAPAPDSPVHWITQDLDGPMETGELPERVDAVVHLAVSLRHREFPDSALEQFRVNLASTARLLDYARRTGAGGFVLMSTGSVYNTVAEPPMRENEALAPRPYFAATKAAAELLLEPYSELLAPCSLRLFFPYGPGQAGRLIPDLVERVTHGRPIQLFGDEHGMRICPTYIDDVVAALETAVREGWRGIYNLGGPEVLSLRELAEKIGRVVGATPIFESAAGTAPRFEPDLARLHGQMDTGTFRTFEEGIRLTLAGP